MSGGPSTGRCVPSSGRGSIAGTPRGNSGPGFCCAANGSLRCAWGAIKAMRDWRGRRSAAATRRRSVEDAEPVAGRRDTSSVSAVVRRRTARRRARLSVGASPAAAGSSEALDVWCIAWPSTIPCDRPPGRATAWSGHHRSRRSASTHSSQTARSRRWSPRAAASNGCACRGWTRRASSGRSSIAMRGPFRFGPADVMVPAARRYLPGTMILETSWGTRDGLDHRP